MSDNTEWLQSLKAGDKVAYATNWHGHIIDTVGSTTRTMIRIGSSEFNRKDGYRRGGSRGYGYVQLEPVTDAIRDSVDKTRLVYRLRDVKWKDLDLTILRQVAALLPVSP